MEEWHYSINGTQAGPVTADLVRELLSTGQMNPATDLVWKDGMSEWAAAATVPELSAAAATGAAAGAAAPAVAAAMPVAENPYATPQSGLTEQVDSQAILPRVKPANYGLMAGLIIAGVVIMIGGFGTMIATLEAGPESGEAPPEAIGAVGALVIFGGMIPLMIGGIMSLIYLYRAWVLLQPRTKHATPGKAVGFLFIPFFNLYWYFVAYWRWSQEWNRLVASDPAHPSAPRMSEGLFLTYAILQVAGIVAGAMAAVPAIVVFFILMKGMCNAINYAAGSR